VDFVEKADLSFAMLADGSEILPAGDALMLYLKDGKLYEPFLFSKFNVFFFVFTTSLICFGSQFWHQVVPTPSRL
jgi:hypothetical protein